jgi:hypothetical protein
MGWSEDLNNGETLLRTVDRLPQFMQLQWAEKAESVLKLGMRPRFSDLTRFVQDKADVATNMFGKHIIESKRKSKDLPKTVINEASRATTLTTTKEEPFPRNEKTAIPR